MHPDRIHPPAGQPDAARRAGALAVALSGGFMALMAVIILATRDVLGYMFSTDPRVIEVFHDIAAFAALFQVRFRFNSLR